MTVYFDQYIQDGVDAEGFDGVAAIRGANVVSEPAGVRALEQVVGLIGDHDISRVEFIHRHGTVGRREYRGAILYRDAQFPCLRPHVHVLNALLGYHGSGPMFSRSIMEHLGMSRTMFDSMNDSLEGIRIHNQPYAVRVLRVGGEWLYDTVQPSRGCLRPL